MKNYSKIGNRKGQPAYRTPSRFIYEKSLDVKRTAPRAWHLAARLDRKGRGK
jgi:hypothetical protein